MKKLIFLSALFTSMVMTSCGGSSEQTEEAEDTRIPIRYTPLEIKPVSRDIAYAANLEANQQVFFAPELSGTRIKKIYVEAGDRITPGQLLVQMDSTNAKQQKITLDNLEIEYNRCVKLMETGSVSQQTYDNAVAQYEAAKTVYENLLANTQMRAPFTGYVTGKFMEDGELYTGAAYNGATKPSIISIEQINPMKAYIDISEKYYTDIKEGMPVELITEVYKDRVFNGKINIKYPSINSASRTFTCEVLYDNPAGELRPGMYGTMYIKTGVSEAVLVQSQAVLKVQGANDRYLFILDPEDETKAKRVSLKILNRYDDYLEVRGTDYDLKLGDKVVTTGQARLIDGSEIKVVE